MAFKKPSLGNFAMIMPRHQSLGLILLLVLQNVHCFSPMTSFHRKQPSAVGLWASTQPSTESTYTQDENDGISDVDARILKEMLSEGKLDLETEADVKKLLERGTQKKVETTTPPPKKDEFSTADDDSNYASTFFRTKLWKTVSAQANDLLESAKIWMQNKVENDVKVLAALGIYAWDRAIKDVARALPATSSSMPSRLKILQLGNTSSFAARPRDEFQSVSRAVWDILQGNEPTAAGRGLRTAAPAGTVNRQERQRRALQQSRKVRQQQGDVSRMAGSLMDTAYELRQELSSEASPAGYRTTTARKALQAGATNLLRSAKEAARLRAAQRQQLQLQAVQKDTVLRELIQELKEIEQRLKTCIENPGDTWLQNTAEQVFSENDVPFSENDLRDVITDMILLRDNLSWSLQKLAEVDSVTEWIACANATRTSVAELCLSASNKTTSNMGSMLYQSISNLQTGKEKRPLLSLRVEALLSIEFLTKEVADDLQRRVNKAEAQQKEDQIEQEDLKRSMEAAGTAQSNLERPSSWTSDLAVIEDDYNGDIDNMFFVNTQYKTEYLGTQSEPAYVDVIPEVVVKSENFAAVPAKSEVEEPRDSFNQEDKFDRSFVAELVSDDDFDEAFGRTPVKETSVLNEDEDRKQSVVEVALLRSLDVAFFVIEKVIGNLPRLFELASTASKRVNEVVREGRGYYGWKTFEKISSAKGRY